MCTINATPTGGGETYSRKNMEDVQMNPPLEVAAHSEFQPISVNALKIQKVDRHDYVVLSRRPLCCKLFFTVREYVNFLTV